MELCDDRATRTALPQGVLAGVQPRASDHFYLTLATWEPLLVSAHLHQLCPGIPRRRLFPARCHLAPLLWARYQCLASEPGWDAGNGNARLYQYAVGLHGLALCLDATGYPSGRLLADGCLPCFMLEAAGDRECKG